MKKKFLYLAVFAASQIISLSPLYAAELTAEAVTPFVLLSKNPQRGAEGLELELKNSRITVTGTSAGTSSGEQGLWYNVAVDGKKGWIYGDCLRVNSGKTDDAGVRALMESAYETAQTLIKGHGPNSKVWVVRSPVQMTASGVWGERLVRTWAFDDTVFQLIDIGGDLNIKNAFLRGKFSSPAASRAFFGIPLVGMKFSEISEKLGTPTFRTGESAVYTMMDGGLRLIFSLKGDVISEVEYEDFPENLPLDERVSNLAFYKTALPENWMPPLHCAGTAINVREMPSTKSRVRMKVNTGDVLYTVNTLDRGEAFPWIQVENIKGETGWLYGKFAEKTPVGSFADRFLAAFEYSTFRHPDFFRKHFGKENAPAKSAAADMPSQKNFSTSSASAKTSAESAVVWDGAKMITGGKDNNTLVSMEITAKNWDVASIHVGDTAFSAAWIAPAFKLCQWNAAQADFGEGDNRFTSQDGKRYFSLFVENGTIARLAWGKNTH